MTSEVILRESRKSFFFIYLIVFILLGTGLFLVFKDIQIPQIGLMFILGTSFVGLAIPEIARRMHYCTISTNRLTMYSGLAGKKQESLYTYNVTDVICHQRFWHRILNYGPISIRTKSHFGKEIKIGNINDPREKTKQILALIDLQLAKATEKKDI